MANPKQAYKKAKVFFEQGNFDTFFIANQTGISTSSVLSSLSLYLDDFKEQKQLEKISCPWCNKEKSAVTDVNICGHVFHYL